MEYLTIDDLTRIFKVSRPTIRKWSKNKILPEAVKIGGVIRWRASDIAGVGDEHDANLPPVDE